MYPHDGPHGLHGGEIHQTKFDKFSNQQRQHANEEISVWHPAKEKNGEVWYPNKEKNGYIWHPTKEKNGEICQTLSQTKPESRTHENAHQETFEVEDNERRTLQCHGFQS